MISAGEVSSLYGEGVEAVERLASEVTGEAWDRPVCGDWSAATTVRHLLVVTRWYHDWLDRAAGGVSDRPFPGSSIDDENEKALRELADVPPTEAVAEFLVSARGYLDRVVDSWDRPFGYPFGVVTAGLHCGVAAAEWHLHAWDLSQLADQRHEPADPRGLFVAAGSCLSEAQSGFRAVLMRRLVVVGSRWRPWPTMLSRSGR